MRTTAMIALAGALAAFGTVGLAQEADETMDLQEVDASIDTDGDGTYSLEELQALHDELDQDTYDLLDEDSDGSVNPAEYQTGIGEDGVLDPPQE